MSTRLLVGAGCAIALATLSLAQGPAEPGPDGASGPPGAAKERLEPGGPLVRRFRFGPPGPRPFGMGHDAVAVLGIPPVRVELELTREQTDEIDRVTRELENQRHEILASVDPLEVFGLEEADRHAFVEDLRRRLEEPTRVAEARIAKFLKASQNQRWKQLQRQREGAPALLDPKTADELSLTSEQRDQLKQLEAAVSPPHIPFGGPPGFPPVEDPERQRRHQELLAVLTSEQKAKWETSLGRPFAFPPVDFGPGGLGGPMHMRERTILARYDQDGDGRLDRNERQAARVELKEPGSDRRFGPPGGGLGGFGHHRGTPQAGARVLPDNVTTYPDASLYEPTVLRSLFLDFEGDDWEQELADFHETDVEVPATLTVDGVKYPQVGVHFRGMSSFGAVPQGYKRSLNVSLDFGDPDQRLYGVKTLNLLNAHEDASFLSTVLYSRIARTYIPAPKANFVKVVINGESWGIYVNVQQFNKEFLSENYPSSKGARWKVRGSPGGGGGLEYLGDEIDDYRRRYEIKSNNDEKSWRGLIRFCQVLNETPTDELAQAIEPLLDVDGLLWFLALDVALINNDGYWVRASDYSLFRDAQGKFHVIPHDMNEAFHGALMMGPGGPVGPGGPQRGPGSGGMGSGGRGGLGLGGFMSRAMPGRGGGVELDPLVALDDPRKPLRSKILAVPEYRARYLAHVQTIAENSLDWKMLGPMVAQYRALILDEVKADTRKLESFEAFTRVTADQPDENGIPGRELPLRTFADQRRAFLLNHPDISKVQP